MCTHKHALCPLSRVSLPQAGGDRATPAPTAASHSKSNSKPPKRERSVPSSDDGPISPSSTRCTRSQGLGMMDATASDTPRSIKRQRRAFSEEAALLDDSTVSLRMRPRRTASTPSRYGTEEASAIDAADSQAKQDSRETRRRSLERIASRLISVVAQFKGNPNTAPKLHPILATFYVFRHKDALTSLQAQDMFHWSVIPEFSRVKDDNKHGGYSMLQPTGTSHGATIYELRSDVVAMATANDLLSDIDTICIEWADRTNCRVTTAAKQPFANGWAQHLKGARQLQSALRWRSAASV
jgi:hypothetical protein